MLRAPAALAMRRGVLVPNAPAKSIALRPLASSLSSASGAAALPASGVAQLDNSTKLTTLSNGLRVCSENSYGQIATVGMLVNAGSRHQNIHSAGVAHLVDRMAFKSTKHRSMQTMLDELILMGGNITASASRESINYTGTVFRHHIPQLVELIADTVLYPNLLPEELEAQKVNAAYEFDSMDKQIDLVMGELVHVAAYHQNTLGLPLLCPDDIICNTSVQTLKDFRASYFRPGNLIFTGAGVDHDELVDLAETHFGGKWNIPGSDLPVPAHEASKYTGGEIYVEKPDLPLLNMSIAFEGVSVGDPDLFAIATLNMMMGGGGSFSVGGPGKGMYSRFYTRVLNIYHRVESAQCVTASYTDSGLFMINCSSLPEDAHFLLAVITKELRAMSRHISEEELSRAKNQLRSSLLMNLETKGIQYEDISRQVQAIGYRMPVEQVCASVDAVTVQDIVRVAKRILSSNPTLAIAGDLSKNPPTLSDVVNRLKA